MGDQPPDMATTSQATVSMVDPLPFCAQTSTPVTRLEPKTLATALPASTRMPAARACSARAPPPAARASRITGTSSPSAFMARAVR